MTFLPESSLVAPSGSSGFRQRGSGAAAIGAYVHAVTPALIVVAALGFHALHNGLPLFTLVVLVSVAYGRSAWHDFIQSKMLTGSVKEQLFRHDEVVAHRVDGTGTVRDAVLGVEATR